MVLELLFVGDVHLGRRPGHIPRGLQAEGGPTPGALGPVVAWQRTVEFALARRVDAVVLAGDVIDDDDDFFEAYAPLRDGVARLIDRGVPVFAVAGNHDVDVLPRLAKAVPDFRLLGAGGVWEAVELVAERHDGATVAPGEGDPGATLLGWSFPERRVAVSPLAGLPEIEGARRPVLGVLHCDRDQAASPYAPVSSAELERAAVDAWLLGHIHVPDSLDGRRPIGYLGSLTALDPTETGPRGPWVVTVDGATVTAEQAPLAPLRWEHVELDASDWDSPGDAEVSLVAELEALAAGVTGAGATPAALGCRIALVGQVDPHLSMAAVIERVEGRVLRCPGTFAFVDTVTDLTSPAVDLAALARGSDPPSVLARKLLVLDGGPSAERDALIGAARGEIEAERARRAWGMLELAPVADADVLSLLRSAGRRSLGALLGSRREPE